MKKSIVFLGLIIVLLFYNFAFSKDVIRLATGEWPPFISETLKDHGVVMRIIKESFAIEGVAVQYEFFPWGRAEKLVEKGLWDGLAVEPQNPAHFSSDIIVEDKLVFFHLKDVQFDWHQLMDLKGYKIGGVVGNTYGEAITKLEKKGSLFIDRVPNEELNFRKLLKRRIDVTPMGLVFGCSLLDTLFSPQDVKKITYHSKKVRTSYYRLSLSKKVQNNEKMLERFNRGLRKLKASGKYFQILEESLKGNASIDKRF